MFDKYLHIHSFGIEERGKRKEKNKSQIIAKIQEIRASKCARFDLGLTHGQKLSKSSKMVCVCGMKLKDGL